MDIENLKKQNFKSEKDLDFLILAMAQRGIKDCVNKIKENNKIKNDSNKKLIQLDSEINFNFIADFAKIFAFTLSERNKGLTEYNKDPERTIEYLLDKAKKDINSWLNMIS